MTMVISGSDGVTFPDSTNQFSGGAFSFKNRIINGDMRIAQRGTSFAGLTDGGSAYTLDRWRWAEAGTSTAIQTVAQSTSVPANSGFANSLQVTTTTAHSPLAATSAYRVQQIIEGFNAADLMFGTANAKTTTLSFWARSSLTGTFGGAVTNANLNRYYVFSYTINAADTWEYKTITIAGDTSGTWGAGNGVGLVLEFSVGTGSDYLTTPGSWGGTRFQAPTGQVNVAGTLNATWYITGVQLEVGSVATPFERRPYGTELALCQRYYAKLTSSAANDAFGVGLNNGTSESLTQIQFPVTMRTDPTALETTGTAGDYEIRVTGSTITCTGAPSFVRASVDGSQVGFPATTSLTAGQASLCRAANTNAYLAWSAEL